MPLTRELKKNIDDYLKPTSYRKEKERWPIITNWDAQVREYFIKRAISYLDRIPDWNKARSVVCLVFDPYQKVKVNEGLGASKALHRCKDLMKAIARVVKRLGVPTEYNKEEYAGLESVFNKTGIDIRETIKEKYTKTVKKGVFRRRLVTVERVREVERVKSAKTLIKELLS